MPSRPRSSSSTSRPPPSSTTTSRRDSPDSLIEVDDRRRRPPARACPRPARARRRRRGCTSSSRSTSSDGISALAAPTSSVVQSATSTFGWTSRVAVKLKSPSDVVGQLVVVLGRGRGPDPRPGDGGAVPAADVALDRLRVDAILADARDEHGHRHLALAEAGDLQGRGQIGRRVLDRVTHVRARHVDAEAHLVGPELLDTRLHESIQADRLSTHRQPASGTKRHEIGTKRALTRAFFAPTIPGGWRVEGSPPRVGTAWDMARTALARKPGPGPGAQVQARRS